VAAVSLLSARSLSKAYGPTTLFEGAAVTADEGDRIGLLGINGSGKSTLLRVLAGLEPADSGVIDRRKGARVLYLPQEPVLDPHASARAIALEGLNEWYEAKARHAAVTQSIEGAIDRGDEGAPTIAEQARLAERIDALGGWDRDHVAGEILHKLGIRDTARMAGTMSGGERRRVALARVLVAEPDLAILDEPTNHLDTETIEWLEEHIAAMRGAVLMVTHDRYVLDAVATRVLELERGTLREYVGNYADYLDQKAAQLEHEERVESNRLNLVRRERAWLLRGARARTTKQKARIQRAVEVISAPAARVRDTAKLEASATRTGKTIVELHDVGLELGGRTLIDKLTLHMVKGDRIGVVGPNGAGKTSLLKLVNGELEPTRGHVVRGVQTKIAYFDQARADLKDDWSIFDNVADREGAERTGGGMVRLGDREVDLRTYLEQFLFEGQKQRQKVSSLSGGERARVALAKLLKTGSNLLLLDEPTNDLDIATLSALEEMLATWPGCALVVTHDRYFLNRVATSILAFDGASAAHGSVVHYSGDYDAYRAARLTCHRDSLTPGPSPSSGRGVVNEESRSPSPASRERAGVRVSFHFERAPRVGAQDDSKGGSALKPLTYAERLELDKILDVIAEAEASLHEIERLLADVSLYATRGGEVRELQEERTKASSRVSELTRRWEALESRRDVKR
jgi:ABC transport system ATP-binding/permease protein